MQAPGPFSFHVLNGHQRGDGVAHLTRRHGLPLSSEFAVTGSRG